MNKKRKNLISNVTIYVILVTISISMLLPFFWLISSSLKTRAELVARPPVLWPKNPQWNNYSKVIEEVPFLRYYNNSLIVSLSITICVTITSAFAGFAFAKYNFRFKQLLFYFFLSTIMLPAFLFVIPEYFMFSRIPLIGGNNILGQGGYGLLHSKLVLILPFMVNSWGIFLARQFYIISIPDELLEAARIEGASELKIFIKLITPLSKPVLATIAIITFITQWNYLFWPLIISISSPELTTLPVGMKMLAMAFDPARNQQLILAGLSFGIIPPSLIFILFQKYYVSGIGMTGLKR